MTHEPHNSEDRKAGSRDTMDEIYEAIYKNGRLEWIGDGLRGGPHRVLVTLMPRESRPRGIDEVRTMLDTTRGAWGRGKSLDEIDAEIRGLRDEWDHLDTNA